MNQPIRLILSILCCLGFLSSSQAQSHNCKLLISLATTTIDGRNNASSVRPGDTICVLAGQKLFLRFSHLHGIPNAPIVILNSGGQVIVSGHNYGIKIDSCSYIVFSGFGTEGTSYGFLATQVNGAGISVDGLSTDIEVRGIEVSHTLLVGMFAKTDPDTTFTSTREKYTLRNLLVHDNYIHHTGMEGFYLGNTFYLGKIIQYHGKDTTVYPHLLKGVKVYNNRVEYTAWDAIQVSSADSGCSIHDNQIYHDSESGTLNQMSGILNGGGSKCDCYNNKIIDGKGDGIDVFSLGGQKIYNNLIINPGKSFLPDQNYTPYLKHGIYIGDYLTIPGSDFTFAFNTILSPKTFGIRIANYHSAPVLITNNIIVDPGGYPTEGEKSYVGSISSSIPFTDINNLKSRDYTPVQFIAPEVQNFDLKPSSPAVNKGVWIDFPVSVDVLNRNRPFAILNDIGAFECHDSSLLSIPEYDQHLVALNKINPNPFTNFINVFYTVIKKSLITISICDSQGSALYTPVSILQGPGEYKKTISDLNLPAGLYLLRISSNQDFIIKKIISIK